MPNAPRIRAEAEFSRAIVMEMGVIAAIAGLREVRFCPKWHGDRVMLQY
jgi:hypothetical protein